jgi:phosphatidylserine decarboxylase
MALAELISLTATSGLLVSLAAYFFWRYVWFFRNPRRNIPEGDNILSPADGTVVYVKRLPPSRPVVCIKNERRIYIRDIAREDFQDTMLLVGVFMSPFDVHYNRAPISGEIGFIRHYPAKPKNYHMGSMHWRSLLKRLPIYRKSMHISCNERTVTRIVGTHRGKPLSCYVVQIAGGSVKGIESFLSEGVPVKKGQIFGMIRVGSQVDIVLNWKEPMNIRVKPGDKVRAGETIMVE